MNHVAIRPVAPTCGAEVVGIDLRDPSAEVMSLMNQALAEHAVLFVRDQHLTPEQQVELTRRFGPVLRVPYIVPLADHPDVVAVLKEPDERNISTFGGTWHSDFSFLDEPPSLTFLYALELPEVAATRCGPASMPPTTRFRQE